MVLKTYCHGSVLPYILIYTLISWNSMVYALIINYVNTLILPINVSKWIKTWHILTNGDKPLFNLKPPTPPTSPKSPKLTSKSSKYGYDHVWALLKSRKFKRENQTPKMAILALYNYPILPCFYVKKRCFWPLFWPFFLPICRPLTGFGRFWPVSPKLTQTGEQGNYPKYLCFSHYLVKYTHILLH